MPVAGNCKGSRTGSVWFRFRVQLGQFRPHSVPRHLSPAVGWSPGLNKLPPLVKQMAHFVGTDRVTFFETIRRNRPYRWHDLQRRTTRPEVPC